MSGRTWLTARQIYRIIAVISIVLTLFLIYSSYGNASFKDISIKKLTIGPKGNIPFPEKIVHLDLKGAPPKVAYYEWLFPLLSSLGIKGLLLEYEDSFPYSGRLQNISRKSGHYSLGDIAIINQLAERNGLEIVPLIQTFGHMEFVLKHQEFSELRENLFEDDSICVSDPGSLDLIKEMISQVKATHPSIRRIHIGSDEVYHVGEDARCRKELKKMSNDHIRALEQLKIRHIARVAKVCITLGFVEVFAWNDMFATTLIEDLKAGGLGSLITPVVWGYATDVLKRDYFPEGLFSRLGRVFPRIWFASAFKGANGQSQAFMSIDRYLQNHKSYVELYQKFSEDLEGKVQGIMMTGWQRFKHRLPLSELLTVSIPSLVINSFYLNDVQRSFAETNREAKDFLNCSKSISMETMFAPISMGNETFYPKKDIFFVECSFHDQNIYKLIMKDLRLLTWKVNNFAMDIRVREDLLKEVKALEEEMETVFSFYYEKSDVKEILSQYFDPLKRQL